MIINNSQDYCLDASFELEGYDIVEQVISVNGQDMSVNYLLELIEKLNNGEINILEVNVE